MTADLTVVLDRRNTQLSMTADVLAVKRKGQRTENIPAKLVGALIVYGNVLAEASVWRRLAALDIAVTFLPLRASEGSAHVVAPSWHGADLRWWQQVCHRHTKSRLGIARELVKAKLAGQQQAIDALPWQRNADGAEQLRLQLSRLIAELEFATSIDAVMGFEGRGAATWFRWLATVVSEQWGFRSRQRRPPPDAVNALLSLGYTLALARVEQAVFASGLDPAVSFLHSITVARSSLALDAIEPIRPQVDQVVLPLLCNGELRPEHFSKEAGGLRLNKAGREQFWPLWHKATQQWPGTPSEFGQRSLAAESRRQVQALRSQILEQTGQHNMELPPLEPEPVA